MGQRGVIDEVRDIMGYSTRAVSLSITPNNYIVRFTFL